MASRLEGAGGASEPLSKSFFDLLPQELDEIEEAGSGGRALSFRIPTGFADLDALLGGWSQGCLIIIGGRASSGKTTLLLNFCRAASMTYAIPSMLISGEMNSKELQARILSAESRVPLHSIRTGLMGEEDWNRLAGRMAAVADVPIHIATPSRYHFEEISAEAARLAQRSGLKLLLIDSLQWIAAHAGPGQMSSAETSLWELKDLAATLKIPIIISAQAERHDERYPVRGTIQHLRDSSAIERVADVVIMLHRPDQDEPDTPRAGEADLIVAKNRNGPTATVMVAYQYHFSRFLDMAG
jgi:replicative DNA helicase